MQEYLNHGDLFKALSLDTRIRMIELLKSEGPLGAKEIAERLDMTIAAISQQLKVLKHAGLVQCERKGYWIPYSINHQAMNHCHRVLSSICSCENQGRYCDVMDEPISLDSLSIEELEVMRNHLLEDLKQIDHQIATKNDQRFNT